MGPVASILRAPTTVWLIRIGLVAPFVISAIAKSLDWPGAVAEVAALGFSPPTAVALAVIATQAIGSVLVLVDRWCWLGASILAGFTTVATLAAHAFWLTDGAEFAHQTATFFEHVAIVAGFAAVAVLVNGEAR